MSLECPTPDLWTMTQYVAGRAAPDEVRAIEQWRDAASGHRRELDALSLAWRHTGFNVGALDMAQERDEWARIARKIHGEQGATYREVPPRRLTPLAGRMSLGSPARGRGVWLSAAAVTLAILVMVVGWGAGVSHANQRVARSTLTYTTANGQRATITLPDGSTVALDVGSRLEVPAEYATGVRTVRLTGEGIFTVVRSNGTPFTVRSGATDVRVLGTSFLVRHYAADSLTTVAVREGKVAVRSAVLAAVQQLSVGPAGVSPVQPADLTQFSFARGILTLNGAALSDAVAQLDRWYDADIRLGDPTLAGRHIAGEFAEGTIADLAEYLAGTLRVRVVRDGRVLTLYPR